MVFDVVMSNYTNAWKAHAERMAVLSVENPSPDDMMRILHSTVEDLHLSTNGAWRELWADEREWRLRFALAATSEVLLAVIQQLDRRS